MSEYRIPLQLTYAREKADGSGMQPASSHGSSFLEGDLEVTETLGYILAFDIPRWAHITEVKIFFVIAGGSRTFQTLHGRADWVTNGSAAPLTALVANGSVAFDDDSRNLVTVAGAASVLTALDGMSFQAVAEWKIGPAGGPATLGVPSSSGVTYPQWSSALFSEFADTAQDDDPPIGDLRGLFSRLENNLSESGGGGASITLATGDVKLGMCNASFVDPFGKVFVRPSDIGVGPGQIPNVSANWLASQFRNHPSVFARLGDHIRGMASALRFGVADVSAIAIAPAANTMRIYQVIRAPAFSSWMLIIDGLPQIVTFAHPAGSDFRRPSEIWNGVVLPAMEARSNIGGPGVPAGTAAAITDAMTFEAFPAVGVFNLAVPAFPANVFRQRQALPRRMVHLEYARVLEMWDAPSIYDDPPYTEVTISGGG